LNAAPIKVSIASRAIDFLKRNWITLAFFAAALGLYAIAIHWGLPEASSAERIHPWGTDEIAPLGFGELYYTLLAADPRYDPRYPLLFYAIEALFSAPYLLYVWLIGGLANFSPVFPHGLTDPVTALQGLTLAGRLPSLLAGAGTVTLAYLTGRKLWGGKAGSLAGVIVLLLYPMFYYSRTSNVDMSMLFFSSLGVYWFAAILQDGLSVRRATWLGSSAALAIATKDSAYPVFAGMAVWLLLEQYRMAKKGGADWKPFWRAALTGLGVAAGVYLAASGMLFNPERYRIHVNFILHGSPESQQVGYYYSTPATFQGYLEIAAEYFTVVMRSLGVPFMLLFLAGLAIGWRRDRRVVGLALLGILMCAAIVAPVRFVLPRFTLITSYLFAFVAAYGAAAGLAASRRWLRMLTGVVFAAGVVWAGLHAADLTQQMLNDSRVALVQQMRPLLRPGDRVATPNLDGPWNFPRLDSSLSFDTLPRQGAMLTELPKTNRPEFILIITTHEKIEQGDEFLDPALYEKLVEGEMGYQVVVDQRPAYWFGRSMFTAVNPRVIVLMRDDLALSRR
jgi:hypothetical protein